MHSSSWVRLKNYELYSSSLIISLYADENAIEKQNEQFISQLSVVVSDICCKKDTSAVNTLKLNNLTLQKATVYMLHNNIGSII
jgi:hypothetical protein